MTSEARMLVEQNASSFVQSQLEAVASISNEPVLIAEMVSDRIQRLWKSKVDQAFSDFLSAAIRKHSCLATMTVRNPDGGFVIEDWDAIFSSYAEIIAEIASEFGPCDSLNRYDGTSEGPPEAP